MRMAIAFTVLTAGSLSGCATLTEDQRYSLENKRIMAEERFYYAEAACQKMGGAMQMAPKRWGERNHRDYAQAKCVKY